MVIQLYVSLGPLWPNLKFNAQWLIRSVTSCHIQKFDGEKKKEKKLRKERNTACSLFKKKKKKKTLKYTNKDMKENYTGREKTEK